MDDTQQDESLPFDEFPRPTFEAWQVAAVESLGGKPLDKLTTPTYEGIPLQPLYRREDTASIAAAHTVPGQAPYLRGAHAAGYVERPWAIAQELAYGRPAAFNQALRFDLEHGQTAVNLLLDGPTRAGKDPDAAQPGEVGRGGVSLASVEDVAVALKGVDLAAVPLFVRAGTVALPLLALLVAHLRRAGRPVSDLHGCLEDDPLGVLAHEGALPLSLARAYDEMAQLTLWAAHHAPRLATVAVHTYPYHNAGANAVQELAFALATGVAYVRALTRREVDVNVAAAHLRFDFAVGGNFFMEIAKLRAARLLWAQAVAAFGGNDDAQRMRLHARTARRNKTAVDPYANMLRVTTEALAAAVGGVESLHVSPFDEPIRPPDDFSRRIARNVQVILQEEAHLTEVIDPAGGAYAVEALTDQLAREAWALFQEVEHKGGMAEALKDGLAQSRIAAVADQRAANLAKRRDVVVGANQFANPNELDPLVDETDYEALHRERAAQISTYRTHDDDAGPLSAHVTALERLADMMVAPPETMVETAIAAALSGASLGEITRTLRLNDSARPTIVPVSLKRASEPFEALRNKAAGYTAAHGAHPRLFLANLGPPRQHKARADFAQGFFEVGGFEVLTNNGFPTPEAAAAAALKSGAPAVVICSTDETYPDVVPPLAEAIRAQAPETVIILAGRPAEQVEALKATGVDEFIYFGADCLALNEWLIERISA
ncbi:MAG: acyl-CoA mutase large subunit family protein [Anaerolineae bacterium]|nr:acyl-CoA mutase large subunit family protein [Anaerolineales bacterium]MCB8936107.1 acyl-CoA mutase large subunit family protein [Promineifilum sp.]MCW5847443.1 acyl-CoA mutase large subunit family protein [Anaerolineae bacterium]